MKGLRVAFLTEAGPGIGLGHLRRCLALDQAFARRGAERRVLLTGGAAPAAVGGGDGVVVLDWLSAPRRALEDLEAWRADVAVADSYRVGAELLERLRGVVGCVAAIDDTADRSLPADVVVNGGFEAERLRYRGAAETTFLLGSRYALLDPAFAEVPDERPAPAALRRALVTFGGDPPPALVEEALAALARVVPGAITDVAVGPFTSAWPAPDPSRVRVHRGLASLRSLMREADLAVCGGGVTLYECLAAGTPVVGVCLAENQRRNLETLHRAGVIVHAVGALETALGAVARDAGQRAAMRAMGRQIVDGRGAERVAAELERVLAGRLQRRC